MAAYRLPARYLPPRRFRYPYRKRGAGGADKAIGIGIGLLVAAGLGTTGAVAVTHHAAPPAEPTAVPVTSTDESAFITAVLAGLGAPGTQANASSLAAWFVHEWPSWPPGAANNPLDSTQPAAGSYTFNSVGVQVYPSASEGAQETALTITNGYYQLIASALRSGAGLCGNPSLAGEFLTWSGGGYSGVC